MNMRFYEKLIISIIVFLGVTIATAYAIGLYVNQKNTQENNNNSLVEYVHLTQ